MLVWHWGAALNIASGALMAALGATLLLANPRKDWNRLFALLAVFWGAQIVSANGVRVTDDAALARLAGEVSLALLLPLYFFAVSFAAIFPRPRGAFGRSGVAVALLALPAGLTLAVLFIAPRQLIAGVAPSGQAFTMLWGPLLPYLVTAPFYGAVFYALFVMMRRLGEAESAIERSQITFVLAALAIFVAYNVPIQLASFGAAALGLGTVAEADRAEAGVFAVIMLAGLALLAALAAQLGARANGGPEAERRGARRVLAAVGLAFLAALAVAALGALGGPQVELLGLVRVASVGLIVYAIARYQLFDLDLRVKLGAATATAALAVAAVAAAVWLVLQQVAPPSLGGVVAGVVGLAAFIPVLRAASRVADRVAPAVSREGDHLYLRKLEVYRASVEEALASGRAPLPDEPGLVELRRKLGLTERDHGIVVSLAVARAEPRAAPDLRPGAVAFGKYAVERVLAEGGFGRVVLARDKVLGRPVVIKELLARWRGDPGVVRTFLREAQVAGQLNHPNIVAVHGVEQHGQDAYVVMEYVEGGTLEEGLKEGPLPLKEALRIARGVLEGLAAAHARGVVHRDVKPANILLGSRGEVKLADFGIAHLVDEDAQRTISGLSTPGFQPGTPQYMSPEQARGSPIDARSDVYAAGAVLYRMLAGKPPIDVTGLGEVDARAAIAGAGPPRPVEGLPEAVQRALARALAPQPGERFPSARAFAGALGQVSPARPPRRP